MQSGELLPTVAIIEILMGSLQPGILPLGGAKLTLYRSGLLKAITEDAERSYKDHTLYTFGEPGVLQPSSFRSVSTPALDLRGKNDRCHRLLQRPGDQIPL